MGSPEKARIRGLYAIIDLVACGNRDPREIAAQACAGGATIVQLRAKRASGEEMLRAARRIRDVAREHGLPFIVNDRVDVALLAEADGVHLGQGDLPLAQARRLLPPGAIIGLSTHNLDQVRAGQDGGADYLGFGPVFTTTSKAQSEPVQGLVNLAAAVAASRLPVVAIGGIAIGQTSSVHATGAAAVAVISGLLTAPGPLERARAYVEAWR